MKISTRTRYGLRLMLNLALKYGEKAVFLKDIAKEENISLKYLSQIIIPIKGAGLVNATRGVHGGYSLARKPDSITVGEIFGLLEGGGNLVACLGTPGACEKTTRCAAQEIWKRLSDAIAGTLKGITLEDLVKSSREKGTAAYNI
jgi:Rrf2 family protein